MRELKEIREEINEIDEKLIALFKRRMDCAKDVGEYKKAKGIPVLNQDREQEILDEVLKKGGEYGHASQLLYSNIMELSRGLQHNIIGSGKEMRKLIDSADHSLSFGEDTSIAFSGIKGANSHIASLKLFPKSRLVSCKSFGEVFEKIEKGEVSYGVVPVENSSAGSVSSVYDLILKHRFYIVRSLDLKIDHNLCALEQSKISDIKEVWSHPQALSQCSETIAKYNLKAVPYDNTATAARDVKNEMRLNVSAICSTLAAKEYGLKILKEKVQNSSNNTTRFIVISKKLCIPENAEKISLCFSLPHVTGSLYSVLCRFNSMGLNLTKIESRPMETGNFEYLFYLDFTGNVQNEDVKNLLCALSCELPEFSFLGNYHEGLE
ncbi:MAG: prephenate dehydratase [Acutalibacteraceae bacterium]